MALNIRPHPARPIKDIRSSSHRKAKKAAKGASDEEVEKFRFKALVVNNPELDFDEILFRQSGSSNMPSNWRGTSHYLRRQGKVWIRIFPDVPVTAKPLEVRQGKGKGSVEYWAARVKPGRVMFELEGVSEEVAREAFDLAAIKLPVKTKFITRVGG